MSLKYSVLCLLHTAACGVAALAAWEVVGWFALLFVYAALPVLLLAVAHAGARPGWLFKRASGQHSVLAWLLFGPYFLVSAAYFGVYRRLSVEPAVVQVGPNLFFGRRLAPGECAGRLWVSVLDLTAEFAEVRPLRALAGYRSLPVLNDLTEAQLRSAVAWVAAAVTTGPVYIHCVFGHNRSACVVIAYWLSAGAVATVAEGERRLRSLRRGVRLLPCHRRRLRVFELQAQASPNQSLQQTGVAEGRSG